MDNTFVYRFINDNPICHLANVHNGIPHVRALLLYRADEEGIFFHTSKAKDLYTQLTVNRTVELCFNNYDANIQIRISGKVELIENTSLKNEIIENREQLKPWILHKGIDMLCLICMKNGIANIWTPELTFMPKRYIRL